MSTRIMILGCGYVGTALARHWQTCPPCADAEVIVTTTTPDRLAELRAIAPQTLILAGNDPAALRQALDGIQVLLLTLGAKRGTSYADTYLKTAQTLAQVLPDNSSVEQIIYTGSYAVYGNQQGNWVSESTSIKPENENGEVLAETERVLQTLVGSDRRVCLFRLGGIYGPGRELARIFQNAAGKTRPGDGSDASNWVHLEDIVGALDFAVKHRLQGVYNLVNSHPISVKQLLDGVCDRHHLAPIHWDPSQPSPRSYNAKVSNQKLREAGYIFQHPRVD